MADMPKWSKECKECLRRYPTSCGVATCLACKKPLERAQKQPTVSEDEWKTLSFVYGRVIPGPLSDEDREAWEADWELLEWRAQMASSWWGVADLLAAWPYAECLRPSEPTG